MNPSYAAEGPPLYAHGRGGPPKRTHRVRGYRPITDHRSPITYIKRTVGNRIILKRTGSAYGGGSVATTRGAALLAGEMAFLPFAFARPPPLSHSVWGRATISGRAWPWAEDDPSESGLCPQSQTRPCSAGGLRAHAQGWHRAHMTPHAHTQPPPAHMPHAHAHRLICPHQRLWLFFRRSKGAREH